MVITINEVHRWLIDLPFARSIYALILVVNRAGTLAEFSEGNFRILPDITMITLSSNVGISYRTADQITGLFGQLPDTCQTCFAPMQKEWGANSKICPSHNFCLRSNFKILRTSSNCIYQGYLQFKFQIFSSDSFVNI